MQLKLLYIVYPKQLSEGERNNTKVILILMKLWYTIVIPSPGMTLFLAEFPERRREREEKNDPILPFRRIKRASTLTYCVK